MHHSVGQFTVAGELIHGGEGHQKLCGAMDINGIRFVMIIFGSAVRLKEFVDIEVKAEPDVAVEGCVAGQRALFSAMAASHSRLLLAT